MTESEWLGNADPLDLLAGIREAGLISARLKSGRRKLRLFAAACCHRIAHLVPGDLAHQSIELCECWADGQSFVKTAVVGLRLDLSRESERAAIENAGVVHKLSSDEAARKSAALETIVWATSACLDSLNDDSWAAANQALASATMAEGRLKNPGVRDAQDTAHRALLQEILGNPFRPLKAQSAWLKWNGGSVRHLADTIYHESRFTDLPVLADALEEAGCTNADILAHLRSPGPHVRGCWALDIILGKQ